MTGSFARDTEGHLLFGLLFIPAYPVMSRKSVPCLFHEYLRNVHSCQKVFCRQTVLGRFHSHDDPVNIGPPVCLPW